jgi:hypothetical protein
MRKGNRPDQPGNSGNLALVGSNPPIRTQAVRGSSGSLGNRKYTSGKNTPVNGNQSMSPVQSRTKSGPKSSSGNITIEDVIRM